MSSTFICCTGAARRRLKDTVAAFETTAERRPHPSLGRQQFRHCRHAAALGACGPASHCVTNQIYYSASERGPEFDLHAMATRPSGRDDGVLADRSGRAGARHRRSPRSVVAMASVRRLQRSRGCLRQPDIIAIPMSSSTPHLRENFAAADVELTPKTWRRSMRSFRRRSASVRWRRPRL